MHKLRQITYWIGRHPFLNLAIVLIVAGAAYLSQVWLDRSEGVLSAPVERGAIVQSVYGIGTVFVNRSFQIKPGVIASIYKLYVREGDQVRKGDKLVQLDTSMWTAPFAATVTFNPFKVGETVFPQTVIMTLVDLADRYLVVSLEQQGALRVQRGQKVKISFDTMRDKNYDGIVSSVYSNDNNFLARIDVAGLPERILPGMTADVAIEILVKKDVMLVPVAALEADHLWVKRGRGMPVRLDVKTGIMDKDLIEINDGSLVPGDRVIIRKNLTP
ncbi:MAG: efflux RND transporter periplasmic adaptor subunit [Bdellovibrionales bacterium]